MSKKCHCEEGLAEWVMSYADMITILMAFFVVMYSMAGATVRTRRAWEVLAGQPSMSDARKSDP